MHALTLYTALQVFDPYPLRHNEWINFHCPFAMLHAGGVDNVPSFGVHVQPPHRYSCFACQQRGPSLRHLLCSLDEYNVDYDPVITQYVNEQHVFSIDTTQRIKPSVVVYPETWLSNFQKAYYNGRVHWYLAEREVSYTLAKQLDIRYDPTLQRICFPVRNTHNNLVGFRCRSVCNAKPKYLAYRCKGQKNSYTLYGENWLTTNNTVVIVEGPFDVAKVVQVYPNVVSSLSTQFNAEVFSPLTLCRKVVTLFDNDAAGDTARKKCDTALPGVRLHHVTSTQYKDPGEMPIEYIRTLLTSHV